jgi:hypothetical protein
MMRIKGNIRRGGVKWLKKLFGRYILYYKKIELENTDCKSDTHKCFILVNFDPAPE